LSGITGKQLMGALHIKRHTVRIAEAICINLISTVLANKGWIDLSFERISSCKEVLIF